MTSWTRYLRVITPFRHGSWRSARQSGQDMTAAASALQDPTPALEPMRADDDPQWGRATQDWTALDDYQLLRLLRDSAS
jgi:hypothetical protein